VEALSGGNLQSDFNNVGVRSFILTGALIAYKTTNTTVRALFAGDGGLQANDHNGSIVDFDYVDDRP